MPLTRYRRFVMRIFFSLIRVISRDLLTYPVSLFMWVTIDLIGPFSFLFIWIFAYQHQSTIGGLNVGQMVAYYLGVVIVNSLVTVHQHWDIQYAIRFGEVRKYLARPLSYPLYLTLEALVWRVYSMTLNVPIVLIVFLVARSTLHTSIPSPLTLHFLLASFVALCLWMAISHTLGYLAFFMERPSGIYNLFYITISVASGEVIPLSLFPHSIDRALHALPFPYLLGFPIESFATSMSTGTFWTGIGIGTLWVVGFTVLAITLWKVGLRRYDAPEGQEQS